MKHLIRVWLLPAVLLAASLPVAAQPPAPTAPALSLNFSSVPVVAVSSGCKLIHSSD